MFQPAERYNLTQEQLETFRQNGFLTIEHSLVAKEELAMLKETITHLFSSKAGWSEGAQFDLVGLNVDEGEAQALPQLLEPASYASELRQLQYRKVALSIAQQLLGPEAAPSFEHAILKPALVGPETPWHQDEAYRTDPGFEYSQVSIWLALDNVTREGGSMQYIPGSNRGELLMHDSFGGDGRRHALECIGEFDKSRAQACPLPAGGIVVHHGLTLHYAGPNTTASPRFAYVLGFELPPVRSAEASGRVFPWYAERETANGKRRRAWLMKGGIVTFFIRKMRSGGHVSPRYILLQFQRAYRYLFNTLRRSRSRVADKM